MYHPNFTTNMKETHRHLKSQDSKMNEERINNENPVVRMMSTLNKMEEEVAKETPFNREDNCQDMQE